MAVMRRIWAALLVAVFGFTPFSPAAFASGDGRKLPPCCQRHGKHRCAMLQSEETSSGPALQTARCPLFGSEQTLPPLPAPAVVKLFQTLFATVLSHPTPRPQTEVLGGISFDRTGQKRGPPVLS